MQWRPAINQFHSLSRDLCTDPSGYLHVASTESEASLLPTHTLALLVGRMPQQCKQPQTPNPQKPFKTLNPFSTDSWQTRAVVPAPCLQSARRRHLCSWPALASCSSPQPTTLAPFSTAPHLAGLAVHGAHGLTIALHDRACTACTAPPPPCTAPLAPVLPRSRLSAQEMPRTCCCHEAVLLVREHKSITGCIAGSQSIGCGDLVRGWQVP